MFVQILFRRVIFSNCLNYQENNDVRNTENEKINLEILA